MMSSRVKENISASNAGEVWEILGLTDAFDY